MPSNITPENLSRRITDSSNNTLNIGLDRAGQEIGNVLSQGVGSNSLVGIGIMVSFAAILWKTDASIDMAAAIMVPTTFFLGANGFLPLAQGVFDGLLLATAAIFAFGLARVMFR